MNLDLVRDDIARLLNKRVVINVYGMRNKSYCYEGVISAIYPYVFTVLIDGGVKSFNYADVIIGDIVIKPI